MSSEDINVDSNAGTLLEMANLARLCTWILRDDVDSYSIADAQLMPILNCQISDLPVGATDIYIGIKTQKCIQQLLNKTADQQAEQIVTEALTHGLEDKLKTQHTGNDLTNSDQAFIALVTGRKNELISETKDKIDADSIKKRHPVEELLRYFTSYVKTRLATVSDISSAYGVPIHLDIDPMENLTFGDLSNNTDLDLDDLSSFFEKTASGLVQDALAGLGEVEATPSIVIDAPENNTTNGTNGMEKPAATTATSAAPAAPKIDLMTDYKELEALVAESTSNYVKTTLNGLSPVPYQPTVPTSTSTSPTTHANNQTGINAHIAESMAAQLPYLSHLQQHQAQHPFYTYTQQPVQEQPQEQPASGQNLPPNQTFPSAILYDKARQAALSKSSAHTRREGLHSTRRPWTQEEEKALMAGLDMVKGPHWSQILTLFGPNGNISDILKDRTQVQLKDKARNLKLFFLKTNSEMPYYLQAVTGELKTRAPTQAARKEAEERARMNSEEDQAKLQGIMTLAGGLQHLPQGRGAGAGVGSGVVTPAQAASAAQAAQGRGAAGVNIPRTVAATMAQARQGLHPATQQTLQAMAQQNPPRPQGQAPLPPHIPRPQSQQTQHHAQQQQGQHRPQPIAQQQPAQPMHQQPQQHAQTQHQHHAKPMGQHMSPGQPAVPPPHPIALPTTSAQHSASHTPSATASPIQAQGSQPHTPVLQQTPQTGHATPMPAAKEAPRPEEPLSQEAAQEAENAAEAALLEGLQAAVAEALG